MRRAAIAGALLLAVAGCSRPVEVTVPDGAADPACGAVASQWPAAVSGREPVAVTPESPAVRAWGDPAIVARCGVATPGPSTDSCISVNGVDWLATPLTDGTRFVTYGRSPALEVLIPAASSGSAAEGSLLPVFTAAAQALPETGRHCS